METLASLGMSHTQCGVFTDTSRLLSGPRISKVTYFGCFLPFFLCFLVLPLELEISLVEEVMNVLSYDTWAWLDGSFSLLLLIS